MSTLKIALVVFVMAIICDSVWFGLVTSSFYKQALSPLLRLNSSGNIDLQLFPAFLVYVAVTLLVVFFALPQVLTMSTTHTLLTGASLGLLTYGLYDLTNYSFLKEWPLSVTVVDILWGGIAFSILTLVAKQIHN